MKVLGIIAEYNPFHNGHRYHLQESVRMVSPDYTVCVMSGNFTQRADRYHWLKFDKATIGKNR